MRAQLPHAEVADAVSTVRASGATAAAKLAFEFLLLTAARSGEVRLARLDEIDLNGEVWTLPAERMKANREHRVPLSCRAQRSSGRPAQPGTEPATSTQHPPLETCP